MATELVRLARPLRLLYSEAERWAFGGALDAWLGALDNEASVVRESLLTS